MTAVPAEITLEQTEEWLRHVLAEEVSPGRLCREFIRLGGVLAQSVSHGSRCGTGALLDGSLPDERHLPFEDIGLASEPECAEGSAAGPARLDGDKLKHDEGAPTAGCGGTIGHEALSVIVPAVIALHGAMQWFSDHWPIDLPWPVGIDRPSPARRSTTPEEAAA